MQAKLIDFMGTDISVVDAARVSFRKKSDTKDMSVGDKKLVQYLAKHGHFTPFTHATITIHEKVPIFVARQRFKHVVGFSYNEVSRRYVSDEPEFHYPREWRVRPESIKQGSTEETITTFWNNPSAEPISQAYESVVMAAKSCYNDMISSGVCPEQARMVLPQSMYTEYYVTGSLFAWARAYKLRIEFHAQKEIQELAREWNLIIETLFPVSWNALVNEEKDSC
jgi:thymidylate synthase (FAD)